MQPPVRPACISAQTLHSWTHWDNLVVLVTAMSDPATGEPEPEPGAYVPKARWIDFERVFCDNTSALPHTMPSEATFEKEAGKLGISSDSVVVIYDNKGIYSSARVWFMFKVMGHEHVYVLDGGLPAWRAAGYATSSSCATEDAPAEYTAKKRAAMVVSKDDVKAALHDPTVSILDARSAGRFSGAAPEPRAGVRSGHIPGSINLPFSEVLNDQQCLVSNQRLITLFRSHHKSEISRFIFSCGSGVTACILALAAYQAGLGNISVYDGSWAEWGADKDLPIEC